MHHTWGRNRRYILSHAQDNREWTKYRDRNNDCYPFLAQSELECGFYLGGRDAQLQQNQSDRMPSSRQIFSAGHDKMIRQVCIEMEQSRYRLPHRRIGWRGGS